METRKGIKDTFRVSAGLKAKAKKPQNQIHQIQIQKVKGLQKVKPKIQRVQLLAKGLKIYYRKKVMSLMRNIKINLVMVQVLEC